ncbi:uncharacterized protein TNCV_1999211 [Trichonephila clavipes]|nr:uncharacterized protein TNCV_1999211 [Trichonephila clavipes]
MMQSQLYNIEEIKVPVSLAKITAKADLEVKRVNNLNLDEDFAHSFKNETILSFKSFDQEVVITQHLNVTEAVVNGFDITSFQNEMDRHGEDGTVHGVKTLENLQIFGHVDAKILNNFVVGDIMHNKAFQRVLGEKRFLSELTTVPGDLVAQNVNFNTFNSIDFQKFIANAVSRTAPKYVITNKAFWSIEVESAKFMQRDWSWDNCNRMFPANWFMLFTVANSFTDTYFKFLQENIAQDLILAEESTLNRINVSQMLNRIVTLNTPQEILSGKRFMKQLVLEKSSTISNLNGEPWSNIVNNVVFVDEYGYITALKTFNGKFEAGDLLIHGFINGINITFLYDNTFFKSGNNVIKQPISFTEDLHIANLQANALIDGLSWDNFIYINQDESLDHAQFVSDVFLSNMHVGGLLNGCNITQLRLQTLFANKKDQFVEEKVIVQSIHIIGNLHLKDRVNEIPVEELQLRFITVAGDQIITTPVHVESDLRVAKLNLANLTNNINLAEILRDAVRHSFPQEILGHKSFQDIKADTLTTGALFIIESLDGIDAINVFNNAVMKAGNKKIFGEKIFHSLKADAVVIHGYINGLRLPQDVVLTSTDDRISGHTSVMSGLSLESDVNVSGKIDGVDLDNFIQNRVTLTEEQLVSSSLSFVRDVTILGDINIDGTVNDLVLELVCKVNQHFPLEGQKIFSQDIHILGYLSTPFINDHDVMQMDLDILRYNREEFLDSLQSPDEVRKWKIVNPNDPDQNNGTKLNCIAIDPGQSHRDLLSTNSKVKLHQKVTLGGMGLESCVGERGYLQPRNRTIAILQTTGQFEQTSKDFLKPWGRYEREKHLIINYSDHDLTEAVVKEEAPIKSEALGPCINSSPSLNEVVNQKRPELINYQILRFAYFVLVQEINMGPTTKILYGYDLTHATGGFSHSMVIWTTEKQCSYLERCCHLEFSHWMRINRSGRIMIEGEAEQGRFYPIRNPAPVTFDKNFVIWSNVPVVESKWCNNNKSAELVLASLEESGEMEMFVKIKDAPLLSDVKTFRRGHLYAVAGFFFSKKDDEYSSAVVYVFNEVEREWREHQTLPSFGVLSLDITHNVNEDEILLAIGTGMGTYSSIYKWNDDENVFDFLQNIPPQYVTSTLWLNARFVHLLAMSSVSYWPKKEGDCVEFLSGGKIDIYVYYNNRAKWIQSINLHGVVSMISFTLAGDTFLVAASRQLQSVYVYELKGYAGFSLIHSMFVGEVRHLNVFTIGDDVYMTVAVASEPSKLLKVVLQGKHALPKSIENYLPLEQSDEAIHDEKFVSG